MKKEVMKKWVKALRSGKYKQGRSLMYNEYENTYCCLGVLCAINGIELDEGQSVIKSQHISKLDISTVSGELPKTYKVGGYKKYQLSALNDSGLSFKQIANIIEKNYKKL